MKPRFSLGSIFAILSLLAFTTLTASAQTVYYWDNDGSTPGFGIAGGNWTAPTAANWTTSASGTVLPGSVTTTLLDTLNFGNGATGLGTGTITVSGTVNAGNITFASGSGFITLNGGTINLAAVQTMTVNNTANSINSILSGAATSVTKAGAGILTLNGANTYTGVTIISAGVLEASILANGNTASSIGQSTNAASNLVFGAATATLRYTGSANVTIDRGFTLSSGTGGGATIDSSGTGTLSFDNSVALNYGTAAQTRLLTFGGSNNGANVFGKAITNNTTAATALTKVGGGTWLLSGTNSYTGTTTVNAGTLGVLNSGTGLTQTMAVLTLAGPDVTLRSDNTGSGTLSTTFTTLTGRTAGNSTNFVFNGGTLGTTNVIRLTQGAGFIDRGVFVNGADYAAMSATNGFVRALAYGSDTNAAAINIVTANNHIKLTATPAAQNTITLLSMNLTGTVDYTQNASQTLTVPGILKAGGGSSTISGGTSLTSGTGIELVLRADSASDFLTISTPISGTGALTKSGAGTVTLSAANSYGGATTVNGGTLNLTGNRTVAAGAFTVINGGTLGISNGSFSLAAATFNLGNVSGMSTVNQTGGAIAFTGGTQLIVGNVNGDGTYNLSAGSLGTASVANRGVILGTNTNRTGIFNLSGTGTLTMPGSSALQISRSETGATNTINTTGIFNQTGGTATVGVLQMGGGPSDFTGNASLNLSGGTFSATSFTLLSGGTSSVSNIRISGTADVTLPAFPTNRGGGSTAFISFDGGTLRPAAASTAYMGGLNAAFVKAGGVKIDVATGRDITITQALVTDPVSTGGGFTKAGPGVLTLSGANSFTGPSLVSGGLLQLNAAAAGTLITSSMTVGSGATLGFTTGTASTLNLAGKPLSLGGTLNFDVGATGINDAMTVGSFTLTGNSAFTFNVIGGISTGASYTVLNSSSPIVTGGFTIAGQTVGALTFTPTINANTITITTTLSEGIWNQPGDGLWSVVSNWTNYKPTIAGDAALFGAAITAPATVTVDAAHSVGYMTFDNANSYTIGTPGSSNLTLDNGANAVTVIIVKSGSHAIAENIVLASNLSVAPAAGTTIAINGALSGANRTVQVLDAGTLILGGANTYTGPTIVNAGTLNLTGSITGSNVIVNNNAILTSSASGVIAGAVSVTHTSSGTSTLTGADTYTGATFATMGTLILAGPRTAQATGGFSIGNIPGVTGTLTVSDGSFTVGTGGSNFLVGAIAGSIGVMNQTGGNLTTTGNQLLIGNSNSTGTYNLSGGTLNTLGGSLGVTVGVNAGSTATFTLSGTGALNMPATSTLQITRSDNSPATNVTASFIQTGGTAVVGILQIGGSNTTPTNNANGTATLSITGGTFTAATFNVLSGANTSNSTINIGGTADVTLPAFPTARGTGATATITFNGGTLRPLAASATYMGGLTNAFIKAGGANIDTSNGSITITQPLLTDPVSLGGGLSKSGSNTLTLTGANTYTGSTTVAAGTLQLNGAAATGTLTSNHVVNSGATLGFTTGTTSTLNLGTKALTLDGGTVAFDIGSAGVSDSMTVGSFTLTNNSAFSFNAIASISSGVTYTLLTSTSPINSNGFSIAGQTIGQLTLTPAVTANTVTLTPILSEGIWNQPGSGLWSVVGNWTNYKPTIAGDAALFGSSITAPATITVDTPHTVGYLRFNNANSYTIGTLGSSNLTLDNGTATAVITVNSGSHVIAENILLASSLSVVPATGTTLTISGNLSGPGSVQMAGTGTFVLAGTNNYTGATTINAGTLSLTGAISGSNVAISNNGELSQSATGSIAGASVTFTHNSTGTTTLGGANNFSGATTVNSGTLNLTGSITDSAITVNNAAVFTSSATGVVGGAVAFTHNSTGTSTLGGDDTYTGGTTVNAGVLNLSGNRTATGGVITVQGGAVMNISGGSFTVPTIKVGDIAGLSVLNQTGGNISFNTAGVQIILGNIAADGTYNLSGGTLNTAAVVSRGILVGTNTGRTGIFNLSGTGVLSMAATSTLEIARSENTAATNSTGIFNQTGGTAIVGELRMGGNTAAVNAFANASLNISGGTFSAVSFTALSGGDTSASFINISGTADVTLPAFPTTRGSGSTATVTFDGGTLRPLTASTTYMGGLTNAFVKAGGARIEVATGNDITITQPLQTDPVSTGGGLTKAGSGVLVLTSTNTYTGSTHVTGGTLQLNGAAAAGVPPTSSVTVDTGAALGFTSGTASTLNLGLKPMLLGGTLLFDIGATGVNDSITVGSFALAANSAVNFNLIGTINTSGAPYTLLTSTNPIVTGGFTLSGQTVGTLTFTPTVNANTITVSVSLFQGIWNQSGDGLWSNGNAGGPSGGNWINYKPTFAGEAALFGSAITGPAVITVDTPHSVGYVTFDNLNPYTIGNLGSSNLTFDNGSFNTVVVVRSGSHTIAENVALNSNVTFAPVAGTTLTISGSLSGVGKTLQLQDAGMLVLAGLNTYTGTTTVSSGTLNLTGSINDSNVIVSNTAVFNSSLTGVIAGATVTFTHDSTATSTLGGADTYSGTTTVSAGTLNLTGNRTAQATGGFSIGTVAGVTGTLSVADGNFTVGGGGSNFLVGATQGATGIMNQTGGNLTTTGNQLLIGNGGATIGGSTGIYNLSGGTLNTVGGSLGVTVGVNVGSTATFNLSGTGVLNMPVNSTLQITRSDNSPAAGVTGTFNQTGGTAIVGILQIGGSNTTPANNANANATLNLSGGTFTAQVFNVLSGANASVSTINISGTADVTLPAFPTARGSGATATITFNGGTLRPLAASTTYMGGLTNAFIKAGGAKIDVASGNDITIAQPLLADTVSLNGGMTKAGSGTLTLTGANTYTGGTVVTEGVLAADTAGPASATGTAAVTVTGGTLRGTGNITGAITLNGGTIAPGDATGTGVLTSTSMLVASPLSGNLSFNLSGGLVNSSQLRLNAPGNLNLGSNLVLSVTPYFGVTDPDHFTLISTNGTTVIGAFSNYAEGDVVFMNNGTGTNYAIHYGTFSGEPGNVVLSVAVIPEPAAMLILGFAAVIGLRQRFASGKNQRS